VSEFTCWPMKLLIYSINSHFYIFFLPRTFISRNKSLQCFEILVKITYVYMYISRRYFKDDVELFSKEWFLIINLTLARGKDCWNFQNFEWKGGILNSFLSKYFMIYATIPGLDGFIRQVHAFIRNLPFIILLIMRKIRAYPAENLLLISNN